MDSQKALARKGLTLKEIQNEQLDKKRNSDLKQLKILGGPFTSPEEVEAYIQTKDISEKAKLDRLYLEVRYNKSSSLSVPKTSPIFKLRERYKYLPLSTYATNLKTYLSKVCCHVEVHWDDFDAAVKDLLDQ